MGKNLSFYWSEKCYACYEKYLLRKFSAVAEPKNKKIFIKKELGKGRWEGKKSSKCINKLDHDFKIILKSKTKSPIQMAPSLPQWENFNLFSN